MNTIYFFQEQALLASIIFVILGLIVGSFLNVVISRYPRILQKQWENECLEFLNQNPAEFTSRVSLNKPRSQCPQCHKQLKIWHNIPVVSYLLLRGRCNFCKTHISYQYPVIEIITAFTTLLVFYRFGLSWQTFAALLFTWTLIAMSGIDFHEKIIPDTMTLPLLWLGLFYSTLGYFTTAPDAIFGAIIGYLFLWTIAKLYMLLRKREGMGYGDFKMLAMLGAWLGFTPLLYILIISSLLGLAACLILLCCKRFNSKYQLPFGPFLAIAGWLIMVYGTSPLLNTFNILMR